MVYKVLVVMLVSLSLVGCGGGGGGGSSATDTSYSLPKGADVDVNSENQEVVTRESYNSLVRGAETTGEIGLPLGAEIQAQSSASNLAGDFEKLIVSNTAILLDKLKNSASLPTGFTASKTLNCSWSGSMNITANVADERYPMESPGDSFDIQFNRCVENNVLMEGSMSATVRSLSSNSFDVDYILRDYRIDSGELQNYSERLEMNLRLKGINGYLPNNFDGAAYTYSTMTGDLSTGSEKYIFNNFKQTIRDGDYSETGTYQNQGYFARISTQGIVQTERLGGAVRIETVEPFEFLYKDSNPSSGQLMTYGAEGRTRLTAINSSEVELALDSNDDGNYENTEILLWSELTQNY